MRYLRFSIIYVLLLTGCTTASTANYYTQTIHGWRGGNVQALKAQWGTPTMTVPGPRRTTVFIYNTISYENYGTTGSPTVGVNFTPGGKPIMVTTPNPNLAGTREPLQLTCRAVFQANAAGTIIDTQIQGRGCYGSEVFARKRGNHS